MVNWARLGMRGQGVRLGDPEQERRFRRHAAEAGRSTTLAMAVTIFAIFAVATIVQVASGAYSIGDSQGLFAIAALALIVCSGVLLAVRREARPPLLTELASLLLIAAIGLITATSKEIAQAAGIVIVAGVLVTYLTSRVSLLLDVVNAGVLTVVLLLAWAAQEQHPGPGRVGIVMTFIVGAHAIGIIEGRRSHRERRVQFAQQELLGRLSATDELTGMANRRSIRAQATEAWETWVRSRTPFAVIMLDIDRFKDFNDTYGHLAGDVALRVIGDTISKALPDRPGYNASRYGGEEFLCLLPDTDLADGVAVAEAIRHRVATIPILSAVEGGGPVERLTVSGGVAAADVAHTGLSAVLQAADDQLYAAKQSGRNQVRPEPGVVTAEHSGPHLPDPPPRPPTNLLVPKD